jgi:glutaredoxin 3
MDRVENLASERAVVVVFTASNCSIGAVAGRGSPALPAVFVGGHLVGGTNRVMELHLAGELKPMLISAGAIWLM